MAECSKGSILQYFRPSLSYHLSLRSLFCLFLSGNFYTGFTVEFFFKCTPEKYLHATLKVTFCIVITSDVTEALVL